MIEPGVQTPSSEAIDVVKRLQKLRSAQAATLGPGYQGATYRKRGAVLALGTDRSSSRCGRNGKDELLVLHLCQSHRVEVLASAMRREVEAK